MRVQSGCGLWLCLPAVCRAHWWQVVQGAWASGGLSWCVPSLCPSLCPFAAFALVVLLANMALFRNLRGF